MLFITSYNQIFGNTYEIKNIKLHNINIYIHNIDHLNIIFNNQ